MSNERLPLEPCVKHSRLPRVNTSELLGTIFIECPECIIEWRERAQIEQWNDAVRSWNETNKAKRE